MTSFLVGTAGALLILVIATSGSLAPKSYLEPWDKNYASKFSDPRIKVVARGLLAPNGHNMQPWIIKLDKDNNNVLYLYGDSSRLTPEIDPPARQFTITQGTFLEYLCVASEKLGYKASIQLFPEGEYDDAGSVQSIAQKPAAKITLEKSIPIDNPCYDAIFLPDTNRSPYQPEALTFQQTEVIQGLYTEGDVILKIFQDQDNLDKIKALALKGMDIETSVHQINVLNGKLTRVNEYQKNEFRYGFSLDSQGSSGLMLHVMQSLLTLAPGLNSESSAKTLLMNNARAALENTPAYIMILTKDNHRRSQVKAGMLYSRLLLTGQSTGLVMQPLSQCLEEYPEMRDVYQQAYQTFAPDGETIQMLVRVGRPTKEAPRSMRRDVLELIKQ